ncbi:MAG TPA: hypothetical protein VJT08_08110 [Terriglobales bacterium]|nr:hypothetical protein [Terriglobales bacterium]
MTIWIGSFATMAGISFLWLVGVEGLPGDLGVVLPFAAQQFEL